MGQRARRNLIVILTTLGDPARRIRTYDFDGVNVALRAQIIDATLLEGRREKPGQIGGPRQKNATKQQKCPKPGHYRVGMGWPREFQIRARLEC
jgi:hypothetical protein